MTSSVVERQPCRLQWVSSGWVMINLLVITLSTVSVHCSVSGACHCQRCLLSVRHVIVNGSQLGTVLSTVSGVSWMCHCLSSHQKDVLSLVVQ